MPTTLDRPTVLTAACRLARRDGVDAIGIRSVAASIGVTPMALYRHVADAGDLRDAMLAQLCESLPTAPDSAGELRRWAHQFRAWLLAVPGLARVVLLSWFDLPPLLDTVEALLQVFNAVGLEGCGLVAAGNSLFSYVLARAQLEEAVRAAGVHRSLSWANGRVERPLLYALRDEYVVARLDDHFEFGLQLLIDGLLDHRGGAR